MIKVLDRNDAAGLRALSPDLTAHALDIIDSLESHSLSLEEAGPIYVLDKDEEYVNIEGMLKGLGVGDIGMYEDVSKVGAEWASAFYLFNNEYGITVMFKVGSLPEGELKAAVIDEIGESRAPIVHPKVMRRIVG